MGQADLQTLGTRGGCHRDPGGNRPDRGTGERDVPLVPSGKQGVRREIQREGGERLNLSNPDIARILRCPEQNVEEYWPQISECLDSLHVGSDNSKIAALATIAVETAHTFKPLHEYGSDALHEKEYGGRLGNVHPGDGAKFAGRGFIQLTGEVNYLQYGKELGIDLLASPEEACEKDAACGIFAAFWHDKKCDIYADAERWTDVRHRVNGGENELAEFLRLVMELKAANAEKARAAGV